MVDDAIRCDACPVLCYIKPGRTGSCDRYGNQDGQLVRLDPHVMLERAQSLVDLRDVASLADLIAALVQKY